MTFNNFTVLINNEVTKRIEENETSKIHKILKNNGREMTGITITREEINISPTIYLDSFYDEYENNCITIEEIVEEILDIYTNHRMKESVDLREIFEYENIKDRIIFKLINTKRNEDFLKDKPHFEICDLSIIFQCLISDERDGCATITIHDAHAKLWGVSKEELYEKAMKNTPSLRKYSFKNMRNVLCELAMLKDPKIYDTLDDLPFEIPMYVLSNRSNQNGASCILYPELLDKLLDKMKTDFYIIPASIHETIIMPVIENEEPDGIIDIIKEINKNELSSEEVLSDSLYIFTKKDRKLQIVNRRKAS